jgi:hypothetical protein
MRNLFCLLKIRTTVSGLDSMHALRGVAMDLYGRSNLVFFLPKRLTVVSPKTVCHLRYRRSFLIVIIFVFECMLMYDKVCDFVYRGRWSIAV